MKPIFDSIVKAIPGWFVNRASGGLFELFLFVFLTVFGQIAGRMLGQNILMDLIKAFEELFKGITTHPGILIGERGNIWVLLVLSNLSWFISYFRFLG